MDGCDLLENIYLCGINNNNGELSVRVSAVVICLKISTFVVSTTTLRQWCITLTLLWFAWKYLPLWYQQQRVFVRRFIVKRCDLLENIYLCGINNNASYNELGENQLWFAWKYLPLWYQQQRKFVITWMLLRCDLLENIYLCGINNNKTSSNSLLSHVVICLKISTFVVSTTTQSHHFEI